SSRVLRNHPDHLNRPDKNVGGDAHRNSGGQKRATSGCLLHTRTDRRFSMQAVIDAAMDRCCTTGVTIVAPRNRFDACAEHEHVRNCFDGVNILLVFRKTRRHN
uniref:Uncharacterized protein n=1 Tax=Anopheles minimus TaxID=112268 RepID=A0A182W817_9DIPT